MAVAITFGTGSATAPSPPTHAAGDILLLCVSHTSGTVTTPTGYTILEGSPVVFSTVTLSCFWTVAASSSEGAPSLAGGTGMWGAVGTVTGMDTTDFQHTHASGTAGATTSGWAPGVGVEENSCGILNILAYAVNNGGPIASSWTNASLDANPTEVYDAGDAASGGLSIAFGTKTTAGPIAMTTVTLTSTAFAALTVAIRPPVVVSSAANVPLRPMHVPRFLLNTSGAKLRFWVQDPDADSPYAGLTGAVAGDIEVHLCDGNDSAFTELTLTTDYTFDELGLGWYELTMVGTTGMTVEGLCNLTIVGAAEGVQIAEIPYVVGRVPATADVTHWLGTAAATPTTAGVPEVDITHWRGNSVPATTVAGVPEVDTTHWKGAAVVSPSTAGVPLVDVTAWRGNSVPATTAAGVPEVDVTHWLGTAADTPDSPGIPNVNVLQWRGQTVAGINASGEFTAASFSPDFVTEVQSGLATAAALAIVDDFVDTEITAIQTTLSGIETTLAAMPDSVWDEVVEGAFTARQYMRGYASALFGKAGGFNTTTRNFRDMADTKNRIVATVDSTGRTAMTLDLT